MIGSIHDRPGPTSSRAKAHALAAVRRMAFGLAQLENAIASNPLGDAFDEAARTLLSLSGRVIVTGVGKSGHVGAKIAATLASTGTAAYFMHPTEASHGDLGMIRSDDAVLAISWSGETRELADVVAYTRRFRIPLIAMTGAPESMLACAADIILSLPTAPEACPLNLAPTTSTILQLAVGDALAITLLEGRGFTRADFKALHPGGKLGQQLRTVGDIMIGSEAAPLIADEASVGDAIRAITAGGVGIVGLHDAEGVLTGVITDGDVRRFLDGDGEEPLAAALRCTPAKSIMTRTPVTAPPDMLAAVALSEMETRGISAIFVVHEAHPVGLVTLLQFLRIGIL